MRSTIEIAFPSVCLSMTLVFSK